MHIPDGVIGPGVSAWQVGDAVCALLDPFERDALLARTRALATAGRFPRDESGGHRYPWPLV